MKYDKNVRGFWVELLELLQAERFEEARLHFIGNISWGLIAGYEVCGLSCNGLYDWIVKRKDEQQKELAW